MFQWTYFHPFLKHRIVTETQDGIKVVSILRNNPVAIKKKKKRKVLREFKTQARKCIKKTEKVIYYIGSTNV